METVLKLFEYFFPMCPNGNHYQRGRLMTNIKGHVFCHHKDCINANIEDLTNVDCIKDCIPKFICAKTFSTFPCHCNTKKK